MNPIKLLIPKATKTLHKYLFFKKYHFSKAQFQMVALSILVVGVLIGTVFTTTKYLAPILFAATTPWTQTDWSGGVASGNVTGTVTTYESETGIADTVGGVFSIFSTNKFSNTGFETDLTSWQAGTSPDSISNLKLWLKADAIGGLSDGNEVSLWEDSSTNNYDFSQGSPSLRPIYRTGIINNKPVVRFDGINDVVTNSTAITHGTIFVVGKRSAVNQPFAEVSGGNSSSRRGLIGQYYPTYATYNEYYVNGMAAAHGGTGATNTNLIFTGRSPSTPVSSGLFLLGQGTPSYAYLNGDIAELVVYSDALSAGQMKEVGAYLQDKYAINAGYVTASHETTITRGSTTGSAKLVSGSNESGFAQYVNVGDTDTYNLVAYAYKDGSAVSSFDLVLYADGSTLPTTFTSAGSGWYKMETTIVGANESRGYGVYVKSNKTVYIDDLALFKFESPSVLTSNILNAEFAADWGVLTYASSGSGGVEVKVRSDVNADMSTATDWASCSAVSSGTDLSATDCVTDTDQYLQYQVTLTPSGASSPVFEEISISFTASDQVDPTTNASSIAMSTALSGGRTVLAGDYNNTATPYFSWNAGADDPAGNGLKGYCVYLGTTVDSDPRTAAGLLTNSPIPSTGTDCGAGGFIVSSTSLNLSAGSYLSSALESGTTYYVYVRAVDLAGNAFSGTNEAEFSFVQDGTAPINISYLSTPGFSFSNVVDMFFSWPTSGGAAASDEHSAVLGYQYQLNGTGDTWLGTQTDTTCDIDYIPSTDASYTLTLVQDGDNIVSGNNIVYFRSVDVACNPSSTATYRTGNLSYGGAAPSFGGDSVVTISPTTATANSFALSWPVASASAGQTVTHYYYMVNTPAPSTLATLQSNPATYLDNGTNLTVALAALPNVNKGVNTVRVVAIDDADTPNYSPSNVISGTFTLDSTDPDNVGNLVGSDSSIKSQEQWNVTLTWTEPTYQGAGNLTYLVYRSDDGVSFTQVGSTTGLSYVDSTPLSTLYYYKIYSRDGAQAVSSGSNAVSLTPTGKWTTPPSLESGPETSKITTKKATITWSTNRTSDSKVSYGTSSGNYYDEEPSNPAQVAAHTINLTNLSPGTTYYYKAKWTDEDGNTGESEEKTFSTSPAPTVIDPQVTNISISSALIQFTVSDASSIKLYYGPSTAFGGLQTISTSLDRGEYTISLSGLTDDTKYFFKINTFDQESEEYEGSVLTFSTLPRPKISQVQIQQVTGTAQTTLLISWLTNTPVSSIVTYYPVANPGQARDEVNVTLKEGQHQTLLRGLLPDTNYGLIVKGIDKAGNQAVSDIQTLTTQTDTRPPQVSGMKVEGGVLPTASGAGQESTAQLVISWNTDEPATSQVEFGEGTGTTYSQKTQEDASLTVNHLVVISNLTPSKVYHVRAISKDKAGNEGVSIDTVTITPKATKNALDLVMTNLGVVFGFLGK
jgi:hypothetical protein